MGGSQSAWTQDPLGQTPPVTNRTLIELGESIYRDKCQNCHGDGGRGVQEKYSDRLEGDLTIGGLTELVSETMPEENPESCVGNDAKAVAVYIHQTFYSEAARVRNRPPRITLSRLTGEQLRQSVADLYGSFGSPPRPRPERGVAGIYFDGTSWKDDKRRMERVDPIIDFDFGRDAPGEEINPQDYYIHWSGSLKVDQSGRYEIVLRSTCSCIMEFGANDRELINNHVQSAGKDEFRRTLLLTAGRAYPFKIEFFQRKRKTEQPEAKVSLSWITPGGIEELIPERNLIAASFPGAYALQTKLPPDDRSYGFERGTSIDRQWDQSTTNAALEFGHVAAEELYPSYLRRHRKDPNENRAQLRQFLLELLETAFRGPVDDETRKLYIDDQVDSVPDDAEAIKKVVLITLKSPRFLYPLLDSDRPKSRRVANRLALTLFDSLPSDDWLRKAAEKNQLETEQQILNAARQMVSDYRTQSKTRSFLYHWFDLGDDVEIVKDETTFPGFDAELVQDLRKSFDAFLEEVIWSEGSDFRQLLQADWSFTTQPLQQFYGKAWRPAGEHQNAEEKSANTRATLERSVSDPNVHVGALTHPFLMSKLAYHRTTSPIHRGVFLTRSILGRVLRPPNAAFTPIDPELHPDLTTRQRVELQTSEANCQVCHKKINSFGFAMEQFDASGRFRLKEHGKPINAQGGYIDRNDQQINFNGARELGDYLAGSEDCHRAFVEAAFEHFAKQPIAAFGVDTSDHLTNSFQASGFNIRELLVSIAMIVCQQGFEPPEKA